jgi:DNA-binding NarL/FixJ family response regulator
VNGFANVQPLDRLGSRRPVGPVPLPTMPRADRAVTVVVADGEPLIRAGIRSVLEQSPGLEVVGEAADGHQASDLIHRTRPDVVIVDFRLPPTDGLAVAGFVGRQVAQTAVILMTTEVVDELIFGALRAGASGFLLKQTAPAELVNAVRAAAAGHAVLTPRATRRLIDQFAALDVERVHRARGLIDQLTSREREVLTQVANGMGNLQIARTLHMSEGAVKAHVSRMLTKLDCTNRVQAATMFHHAGLLPGTHAA